MDINDWFEKLFNNETNSPTHCVWVRGAGFVITDECDGWDMRLQVAMQFVSF